MLWGNNKEWIREENENFGKTSGNNRTMRDMQ